MFSAAIESVYPLMTHSGQNSPIHHLQPEAYHGHTTYTNMINLCWFPPSPLETPLAHNRKGDKLGIICYRHNLVAGRHHEISEQQDE